MSFIPVPHSNDVSYRTKTDINTLSMVKGNKSFILAKVRMNRLSFIGYCTSFTINIACSNAVSFPNSSYYEDAIETLNTQRLAVNNIADIVSKDGKIEEAGFKVIQLSSQVTSAGKIVLSSYQESISKSDEDSIRLLRFLSCQKKFSILIDLCDECLASLQNIMRNKTNGAAGQIRTLAILEDIKLAFDDFLMDVQSFSSTVTTTTSSSLSL